MESLNFIGTLLLVVLVFNLMIVVHEWGHFLAARWRGLKIDNTPIVRSIDGHGLVITR